MGRRRTTPELQKLKTMDGSPELTNTKSTASKRMKTLKDQETTKRKISPQMVTRARRRGGASTKVDLNPVPKMMDMPMDAEDELQKDANVLTPKMFYSKKCQRSAKSVENNEQNNIPTVKKSGRTDSRNKSKSDLDNCPEQNLDKNDVFPVVVEPKKSARKAKQPSYTTKKNMETKTAASSAAPTPAAEPLTIIKKQNRGATNTKTKTHMTAEEVITELTSDEDAPVTGVSLPVTKKDNVTDKVNSRKVNKDDDNGVSLKRSKTMKAANNLENKKRKVRLSLADIVNEISPDSPEKKSSKPKVIPDASRSASSLQKDSATKQKAVKKSQSKKTPTNENKAADEWDHSLLLITDDFDDSKNVYDFEEFQIGAKSSSSKNSTLRKSEKKNSIKKTAAIKAVLNKRKVNKDVAPKRKVKKTNSKTSKTSSAKQISHKVITPPITTGKTAIGSKVSVENQFSSPDNSSISICNDPFQTPSRQVMKEPVSITELEKVKVTKHIENKVVTKVNPGPASVSDWLQLPNLPKQQFTKLKRCAMEGPTATDNLPENQPKSMMIKTSSAFNQSLLDMSSINTDSSPRKPKPEKGSKKLDPKAPTDNQPIELFTYPVAMPIKNQKDGARKNGKCKEIKQTPVKGLMDFMYAGSVERYLKKPKENPNLTSPPPIMLPKFLHAETSTPNTMADSHPFPKLRGSGDSICISPVKDFQSPASMRTYDLVSRRSSASFHAIIKNVEAFADESKENSPQGKKCEKTKVKKKDGNVRKVKNKNFDEWANRMSNEFDEIEQFELSIEN